MTAQTLTRLALAVAGLALVALIVAALAYQTPA